VRASTARKLLAWLLAGTTVLLLLAGEPRQALAVGLIGGTVGLLFLGGWWLRDRPRADAYAEEAERLGLRYSFEDPHDLLSLRQPLLHRVADVRGLEHVTWGTWNGLDVEGFEYWYAVGSDPSRNDYRRFTGVLIRIPPSWPEFVIEPQRTVTALADTVAATEIDTELERFNREYRVVCEDARFASALVDQRMMAWLMEAAAGVGFQSADGRVLVFADRVEPWQLESILAIGAGFLSQVPGALRSLYPDA
jgi:hypothetical protein